MATSEHIARLRKGRNRTRIGVAAAVVIVLGAVALDTTVVTIGSDADVRQQAFSPDAFGQSEFPRIRDSVRERAVEAPQLADEIAGDKAAAVGKYGVGDGIGPVFPVRFTGVVGEGKSGIFTVAVEGMPESTGIRVQTGPAVNGTDLRDATGDIEFGQFKNQIEYQDAGAGLNRAMKAEVLDGLDRDALSGKTVAVIGVFKLINPKNWLVTPVEMDVQ